jgi:hypothetical protein
MKYIVRQHGRSDKKMRLLQLLPALALIGLSAVAQTGKTGWVLMGQLNMFLIRRSRARSPHRRFGRVTIGGT